MQFDKGKIDAIEPFTITNTGKIENIKCFCSVLNKEIDALACFDAALVYEEISPLSELPKDMAFTDEDQAICLKCKYHPR